MKANGSKTYWGQDFDDDTEESIKRLIGKENTLEREGQNRDETDAMKAAKAILDQQEMKPLNARQIMLKHKQAFGSGSDLTFPTYEDIDAYMSQHQERNPTACDLGVPGGVDHPTIRDSGVTDGLNALEEPSNGTVHIYGDGSHTTPTK